MKKLSKEQQAIFECALDKLYAFLKEKYNVDYESNILCIVYDNGVLLRQCSCPDRAAWFADISFVKRKISLLIREVERDKIYTKRNYELFYMSTNPTIHTIDF